MNRKKIKLIKGILLSFIPLLLFVFCVYGSNSFLTAKSFSDLDEDFLASAAGSQINISGGDSEAVIEAEEVSDTGETIEKSQNSDIYREPELKSAISVETDLSGSGDIIIFQKSSDMQLPIASITKLMTAIVCLEYYQLPDEVVVSQEADSQSAMKIDLKEGDVFSAEELLHIMLIESSNKAAYALSEKIGEENFVATMNRKAKDIGMTNTFFADPTGLSPDNVSTSDDLILLAEYILNDYPEIAAITQTKEYELENFGKISNTNQILAENPNVVLGKTGFTSYANGCLLVSLKNPQNNNYSINVVLGADDRFAEMRKLIEFQNNQ